MNSHLIPEARGWIDDAKSVVVLTGAGISTDSGIPDFRGPQGLWTKNPLAEKMSNIHYYLADPEVRKLSWQNRMQSPAWTAKPNAGHLALSARRDVVAISAPRDGLPRDALGGVTIRTGSGPFETVASPQEVIARMVGESLSLCIDEGRRVVAVTNPDGNIVTFWDLDGKRLALSFMTLAELFRWSIERNWGAPRVDALRAKLRAYVVLHSDDETAEHYAAIRNVKGYPVNVGDAWVAAGALRHGIPLVTHNRKHFEGIPGLRVISEG